jgi:hypothetical protein
MVLAQKQTWRPVEQNRGPRYECTQLYSPNLRQSCQKHTMEKRYLFKKYCWGKRLPVENWKLDLCPSLCTSINSKWIKDIIRPETYKLVQERTKYTLKVIGIGKDFLSRTQVAQQLRERIDRRDYMKSTSSAQQKKLSLNWRDHPQNGRKSLLAIHQTRDC